MQPVKYQAILASVIALVSLLAACGSPAAPAPTPTIVLPTATTAPPTATTVPMLKPDAKIGQMVVKTSPPESDGPPIWAFCSPAFSAEPGVKTQQCNVPPLPELSVGHGWFAADEARRDSNWKATKWELYIDNQRIDLDAFGAVDVDLPQKGLPGQDPNKEVITKLRTWDVLLSNLPLGVHTLRSVLHVSQEIDDGFHVTQPGMYELVLAMSVEVPPPPTATPTPAPTPTLAPQVLVVLAFHDALNAGDVELALTYIADDAVMARGPYGTGHGKQELRAIFQQEVRDGTKFKLSNCQVKGNMVACDYQVTVKGSVVDSGKVPKGWAGETGTEVRNGKIHSDK